MAYLLELNTDRRCFLNPHHSFGRLAYAVDTLISGSKISKHHAIIEWQNDCWQIRDLSRNGTWLNQTKLAHNTRYPLHCGDKIYYAKPEYGVFCVVDLGAPCDLLLPTKTKSPDSTDLPDPIRLAQYHFLPNEENPEMVLFIDYQRKQWFVERLDWTDEAPIALYENDTIEFAKNTWQLKLNRQAQTTELLDSPALDLAQLDFIFELSLDEEQTHMKVQTPDENIDFKVRIHHYLILNLARYKAADAMAGLDSQQQGWIYPEQLMKDIGVDYSHLNIQVHRARKQLIDTLNINDAQSFVERQAGRLRLGASQFKIIKGEQLECALPPGENAGD